MSLNCSHLIGIESEYAVTLSWQPLPASGVPLPFTEQSPPEVPPPTKGPRNGASSLASRKMPALPLASPPSPETTPNRVSRPTVDLPPLLSEVRTPAHPPSFSLALLAPRLPLINFLFLLPFCWSGRTVKVVGWHPSCIGFCDLFRATILVSD